MSDLSEFLPSDMELVGRTLTGEREAFAELCHRHRRRIWRVVTSVARGADAEDLAQEAFVRAYRSLRSYRAESPFEAWLTRIAVNAAHDYQKSAWRRRVVSFDDMPEGAAEAACTVDADLVRREVQRRVRAEVAALPERQRNPIWLHYFEGFSVAEISRLENIAESTVRSRVLAGMKRLQKALSSLQPVGLPGAATVSGGCEA